MDAPIERLIVTRFDLALGLDLLKGHRPLPALGKDRNKAGALADVQIYKAVAQSEPFTLGEPRKVRFVPTGWAHHGSKFWRGFNESYVSGKDPQVAQALPIRARIVDSQLTVAAGAQVAAPQGVVSSWVWPFAVATQVAIESNQAVALEHAGGQARQFLDEATWSAAGVPPTTRSALFKAHRTCLLETLFPKEARPRVNVRIDDFTITTLLAARGTERLSFRKWTLRDRALLFGALLGRDMSADEARTMTVTLAELKLESFALFFFGENGGRALLYLTQGEKTKSTRWAWCLTMNVAHFAMTSLALACLAEDLRSETARAAQRAATLAALAGLRAGYRVRTDGASITEKFYSNHAWVARAVADTGKAAAS